MPYALIQVADGRLKDVLVTLRKHPDVLMADAVRGPYQIIALLAIDDTAALLRIEGVERVVKCVPTTPVRVPAAA